MVAQDTGSAITGPARADIYYGAGPDAGRVSGRFRHNMRFVILVPKSLDPSARGRKMPLPDPRPSEKIAKLFPQVDPLKDQHKDQITIAKPSDTSVTTPPRSSAAATQAAAAKVVPLPEARPVIEPVREGRRHRRFHYYHYRR
jgi:membrane-bound lytic murein transglycosylase A